MPLTIADLPFEMLENVASHLHRKSDLLSLSLACKALQSPCMMQMFRTVDIQFIVNKRELDTTIADAILPAMTAVAPDSTSGSEVTNGSLVKSLRIGLGTTDDIVEDEDFEDGDPVYYQFQRSEPAQSTLAAASCFLHWVADLLCACPNLSTLRMDVPHFSARLAHLLRGRMGDVAVAAAGLRTLRYVSCSDSNLGFRGRGHAVWHRTLLLHRFAGLTRLSLQFESMSPDTLLFWESSLTRPTNLIHLKLQYEGYASDSGSRRMIQFTCRAITGSPNLQRLSHRSRRIRKFPYHSRRYGSRGVSTSVQGVTPDIDWSCSTRSGSVGSPSRSHQAEMRQHLLRGQLQAFACLPRSSSARSRDIRPRRMRRKCTLRASRRPSICRHMVSTSLHSASIPAPPVSASKPTMRYTRIH